MQKHRRDATTEYGDRLERWLAVYVPAAALLYASQGLWTGILTKLYALTAVAALAVTVLCVLRERLYRTADVLLILFFPVFAAVSAVLNFGLSLTFFTSRFAVIWLVLLSLYFALRVTPDPEKTMARFAAASVLGMSLVCISVLLTATASLFPAVPGKNTVRGCFQVGRLCGLSNANVFGFYCTGLFLLSVYAFLRAAGKVRRLWVLSGVLGWFALGLTNCRTGIIGLSFFLGLLVFFALLNGAAGRRLGRFRIPAAAGIAALAALALMLSLYLPALAYRGVLTLFGSLTRREDLLRNLSAMTSRGLLDDETLAERTDVWWKVLAEMRKTPLRTWVGISSLNTDGIGGVYGGHHEILIPHAHSTYLEMLRRFGVLGFALLLASLLRWCVAGVKRLTGRGERAAARCLAAAAAAILLMGTVEQVPFPYSTVCSLSLPFFSICGYCMNERRRTP